MTRVVFDTNTYVSATLHPFRTPSLSITKALDQCQILMSDATVTELRSVVERRKFDRYTHSEDRAAFVRRISNAALFIEPTETITLCRDPKDNKFLELAVAGNADYIITGDDDLLAMSPFRGVQIISPATFIALDL